MNVRKPRERFHPGSGPAAEPDRASAHPANARQNDAAPLSALIQQSPRMQLQRQAIGDCFGPAQLMRGRGRGRGGRQVRRFQPIRVQRTSRLPQAETKFRAAHEKAGLTAPIRITRPDHAGTVKAVVTGSQAGVNLFIYYWNILKAGGSISDSEEELSESAEEHSDG